MRFLTTLLFVLIAFAVSGQKYQSAPNTQVKYLRADSGLTIPDDTTRPLGNNVDSCRRLARKNNLLYLYNCDSAKWVIVSTAEVPEVITASNGLTKDLSDIRLGGVFGEDGEDRTIMGHNNKYLRIQGTDIDNYSTDPYTSEARVRARGIILTSINRINGGNTTFGISSLAGLTSTSTKGSSISSTNGDNSSYISIDNTSAFIDFNSSKTSTGDASRLVINSAGGSIFTSSLPLQISSPLMGIQAAIQSDLLKNSIGLDSVLYTDENGTFKQRKLTVSSIDGLQDSLTTASNGLTKTGSNITLGGSFTSPINIQGANTSIGIFSDSLNFNSPAIRTKGTIYSDSGIIIKRNLAGSITTNRNIVSITDATSGGSFKIINGTSSVNEFSPTITGDIRYDSTSASTHRSLYLQSRAYQQYDTVGLGIIQKMKALTSGGFMAISINLNDPTHLTARPTSSLFQVGTALSSTNIKLAYRLGGDYNAQQIGGLAIGYPFSLSDTSSDRYDTFIKSFPAGLKLMVNGRASARPAVSDSDLITLGQANALYASSSFAPSGAQNLIYATPTSTSGAATLRSLVAADIPALDAAKITTGTLPAPRGGTGLGSLGSSLQQLRVNVAGTALEYFTSTGGDTSRIKYDKVKKAITSSTTIDSTATKWLIDCTSTDVTITLPDASISPYWISTGTNVGYGIKYYILRTDNTAHVLTIQAGGTQKIDGQSNFSIYNNSYLNLFSDGANWYSN